MNNTLHSFDLVLWALNCGINAEAQGCAGEREAVPVLPGSEERAAFGSTITSKRRRLCRCKVKLQIISNGIFRSLTKMKEEKINSYKKL